MSVATVENQSHPNFSQFRTRPSANFDFAKTGIGETIGKLSFDANEAERLRFLDLDQQRRELAKNLEGFKGEVLDDIPVSHAYHYYFDVNGNVFNHPDRQPIHRFETQFDPRERDGYPARGFKKATDILWQNPNSTVLWYSPPGAATEDTSPTNPYSDVTFIYGQLYVMHFDGNKINGVAVKIDREGEAALAQFMPDTFLHAQEAEMDYERIKRFIENPQHIRAHVSEVLNHDWQDGRLYGGKGGNSTKKIFTVTQMLRDVKQQFSEDNHGPEGNEFYALVQNLNSAQLSDKRTIANLYLNMILNHSSMQKHGKTSLQGACGGSKVSRCEIEELLGITRIEMGNTTPTSSVFRMRTQSDLAQQLLSRTNSSESSHFNEYECNHCGKTLSGESKTDKASWRKNCDHCGGALGC